jgi:hypothetical protein
MRKHMFIAIARNVSLKLCHQAIWHSYVTKPKVLFTQMRKHLMFVAMDIFNSNWQTRHYDVCVWTCLKWWLHLLETKTGNFSINSSGNVMLKFEQVLNFLIKPQTSVDYRNMCTPWLQIIKGALTQAITQCGFALHFCSELASLDPWKYDGLQICSFRCQGEL